MTRIRLFSSNNLLMNLVKQFVKILASEFLFILLCLILCDKNSDKEESDNPFLGVVGKRSPDKSTFHPRPFVCVNLSNFVPYLLLKQTILAFTSVPPYSCFSLTSIAYFLLLYPLPSKYLQVHFVVLGVDLIF